MLSNQDENQVKSKTCKRNCLSIKQAFYAITSCRWKPTKNMSAMKKQSHQRESGPVALLSKLFQGSFMFLHINTNYIHKSLSLSPNINFPRHKTIFPSTSICRRWSSSNGPGDHRTELYTISLWYLRKYYCCRNYLTYKWTQQSNKKNSKKSNPSIFPQWHHFRCTVLFCTSPKNLDDKSHQKLRTKWTQTHSLISTVSFCFCSSFKTEDVIVVLGKRWCNKYGNINGFLVQNVLLVARLPIPPTWQQVIGRFDECYGFAKVVCPLAIKHGKLRNPMNSPQQTDILTLMGKSSIV